jgi:hypothetical protein
MTAICASLVKEVRLDFSGACAPLARARMEALRSASKWIGAHQGLVAASSSTAGGPRSCRHDLLRIIVAGKSSTARRAQRSCGEEQMSLEKFEPPLDGQLL